MWTWQFELNDILTTLTIVGVVAGAGYSITSTTRLTTHAR